MGSFVREKNPVSPLPLVFVRTNTEKCRKGDEHDGDSLHPDGHKAGFPFIDPRRIDYCTNKIGGKQMLLY
jgi:hypothetical protein